MKNNFHTCLTKYLTIYLPKQRGKSPETIKSYATAFTLFFMFLETKGIRPNKVTFDKITNLTVMEFGNWLEDSKGRNNKAITRNLRIQAIKSFYTYVMAFFPSYAAIALPITQLKEKKIQEVIPNHLSEKEIRLLFQQPNTRQKHGVRDLTLLNFIYETGLRVSEVININICDITWDEYPKVTVMGKGRKQHIVMIPNDTYDLIVKYLRIYHISQESSGYLFTNPSGNKITRQGINYILKKYQLKAKNTEPKLFDPVITVHGLRHSKSFHLLNNGVDLIYIRDFLNHSSVKTTERYARTSPELVNKAIIKHADKHNAKRNDRYDETTKIELIELLETLKK